jgi:hypothetical protein
MAELQVKKSLGAQWQVAIVAVVALLCARAAHAANWYLMAADEKAISQPDVAATMIKGSVTGPVRFTSRGEYESRARCESHRHKLVQSWRRHSIIARGGWAKHGFTSPNVFVQCISAADPRLARTPGAPPTVDLLLQPRRIRGR